MGFAFGRFLCDVRTCSLHHREFFCGFWLPWATIRCEHEPSWLSPLASAASLNRQRAVPDFRLELTRSPNPPFSGSPGSCLRVSGYISSPTSGPSRALLSGWPWGARCPVVPGGGRGDSHGVKAAGLPFLPLPLSRGRDGSVFNTGRKCFPPKRGGLARAVRKGVSHQW